MTKKRFILKKEKSKFDLWLLFCVLALTCFGILMVYDASSVSAFRDFGDKYHFLKEQARWGLVGLVSLGFASRFDYRRFYSLSPLLLLGVIFLLAAVFIPGLGIRTYGASRWLDLRFFSFQPSELVKLVLVIYLAAWFSTPEKGRLWAFLLLSGIILSLIILQPDMGTAIILALIALVLYFLSGAPLWHFALLAPLGIILGGVLVKIAPYRLQRVLTFLNPMREPLGASYHLRQILIALGLGGFWGQGLGQSRQKYEYLPESMTDSIFAIIGEELGFFGAGILILVLLFIIWRGFKLAFRAPDKFGKLLAAGITSWLGIQTFVNLSAMVSLIPLTGVPLPFISYGGSSLVVALFGVGILLNISQQGIATRKKG